MTTSKKQAIANSAAQPSQVLLFSGHMIDAPQRPQPRFPAAMEKEAQAKIEQVLDQLQVDRSSLAIAPGIACGGDILFIEACLTHQMRVQAYLPFAPTEFITQSVGFAGDDWIERFQRILDHPQVEIRLQPEELGAVPPDENPFERNNRWTLESSLRYGIDKLRLIVLWDGKGGDGQGGTFDMVKQVRQLGGTVEHLDTTKFDFWER